EREYGSEQRNYQNNMNLYNRRQQMSYQSMSDAQTEFFTAQTRHQCSLANGGSMPESRGTRRLDQNDAAQNSLAAVTSACRRVAACVGKPGGPSAPPEQCKTAARYESEYSGSGSGSR
ncbi:MAG: hypothetical protein AAB250_10190, partial [Bdellovibrionota bacterium]